ncbi:hypothetical protein CSPAE12_01080 [Colletotrichum incanum]|nr:hypothetical protein CSPAE12_01080 [Colletotrichum incanum]
MPPQSSQSKSQPHLSMHRGPSRQQPH